jgi:hypothetical protein
MKEFRSRSDAGKPTRRDFMKRSAAAMIALNHDSVIANAAKPPANLAVGVNAKERAYPRRVISWWTNINDLEWPARAVRAKIERRADAMAAAKIDVAIVFGFHYRFDFAPYFGALHGYLNDVATALHERHIQFMDHFSCNVMGRPHTPEDVRQFHTHERHCVNLYPDVVAARDAGYAGFRFNDLRETLIASGEPTYIRTYAGECLCHNNPDFLKMHQGYLQRLFAEIPLDGIHQDDMAFYGSFATCGCRHCRGKFQRQFGRELPPLSDRDFWGDTTGNPADWEITAMLRFAIGCGCAINRMPII